MVEKRRSLILKSLGYKIKIDIKLNEVEGEDEEGRGRYGRELAE